MPRWLDVTTRKGAAVILAAATSLLGTWLLVTPAGRSLENASYDRCFSWLGAGAELGSNAPVAIVYLDLDSYRSRGLDAAHPWPRELHAQLIDRLTQAGARAIGFDILFAQASPTNAADRAFEAALKRSGRVILAAETGVTSHATDPASQSWSKKLDLDPPAPMFLAASAGWGLADLKPDDDFVARRHVSGWPGDSGGRPSLSWALARLVGLGDAAPSREAEERWLRYYGGPISVPHVTYSQALEPGAVMDAFFRDRIIIVGARPMSGRFPDRRDEFRSPYRGWTQADLWLPGVEIHATQLLNLIRRDWLRRPAPLIELATVLCAGLALGTGLIRLRPVRATLAAVAVASLAAGAVAATIRAGDVWLPWLILAGAQVPCALGGTVFFHWVDWLRARRRLEAAKRIADARIREQAALIDKAHDAILVQDLSGTVQYANPSAERLYGWSRAEFEAGVRHGLFDGPEAVAARTAAIERGEWSGELHPRTRAGKPLIVDCRWTLIPASDGRPGSLLVIGNDVTERRQLEAEALRAQRMEAIGALAGGMAHDLNNSLAPVLLGVQLLRRAPHDEATGRLLGLIEAGATRGAGMVKQVLLFARGREGQFGRLDLRSLVNEMAKLASDTFPSSVHVTTQLAADAWPVRGNPTELHQVLLNLCVNARDAMPKGGSLCLAVENVQLDAEEARRFQDAPVGDYVSLLVSDTGSGIPPAVMPRIFEAFFTTKPEGQGTGLGLSTVLRIVRSHGGFLGVTSHPGEGTSFEVLLPRLDEAATRETTAKPSATRRGRGERILVVDDDAAVLELLRHGLAEQGYVVETALESTAALAILEGSGPEPAAILCDATMPTQSGNPVSASFRERWPDIPLLLMTGDGEAGASETQVDLPRLSKPFVWETVLDALDKALNPGSS